MTRTKSHFRCLPIEGVYKKAGFTAYQVRGSFASDCVLLVCNSCTNGMLENCNRLQILKTLQKRGGENPKIPAISEGSF